MEINRAFYEIYSQFRNRMQTLHVLNLRTLSNDLEEIEQQKKLFEKLPLNMDEKRNKRFFISYRQDSA